MNKGFTLIEVIIVICIILLLFVIVWPIGANFYRQELSNKAQQQLVWILKQARSNAVNQKNNANFGVKLEPGTAVLFQGNNFNERNQDQDITYSLPSIIKQTGLQEIVFSANTGFVNNPGTVILNSYNSSKVIEINQLGVLDY